MSIKSRKFSWSLFVLGVLNLWATAARNIPVGGQAVIEGVLMRGPKRWGLSVRRPDGVIWTDAWKCRDLASQYPWKLPILRGLVVMFEMLREGLKALSVSASVALGEDDEMGTWDLVVAFAVAIGAVVALFVALPLWLSEISAEYLGAGEIFRNITEGIIRALVFVGYIGAIGLWKDIREVLRYHGAEHKTINAFEAGARMTPESISDYSRIHPRCGTSFLFVVVAVSIVVFSFVGEGTILWRVGSRVLLLPLVVGLSYELIRYAAKKGEIGRILMSPALSLQLLTTRTPNLKQLEVGMSSLETALKLTFDPNIPGRDQVR